MFKEKNIDIGKRKYIRISTVIPLEFSITNKDKEEIWKTVYQGYTRNINAGGICIEVSNFDDNLADKLSSGEFLFHIRIDMPNQEKPIEAYVDPRWVQKTEDSFIKKIFIGVAFFEINEIDKNKIVKFAEKVYRRPKQIAIFVAILALVAFSSLINEFKLKHDNMKLSKQIAEITLERNKIDKELQNIEEGKQELQTDLEQANNDIKILSQKVSEIADVNIEIYDQKMAKLVKNKAKLEEALNKIIIHQKELGFEKKRLQLYKESLSAKNSERMYSWLKMRQSPSTGLVPSFEGDYDLNNFAFTYDESLVIMNFIMKEDLQAAKHALDFYYYKARRYQGGFLNAYEVVNGNVVEWMTHVGPNIWLGMAALMYAERTSSDLYLNFAKRIGDWVIKLQNQSKDGGIRGGPTVTWFATEHNIDAFAFFRMLYNMTNDKKYLDASDLTMNWLKNVAYNKAQKRFNRGRNDNTIATDTASFGIPAIGPKRLYKEGIDPELLIAFAEKTALVTVVFKNKDGKEYKIQGFDYTDPAKLGRPGIVSSEWTAQMITTYNLMADYFEKRDKVKSAKYKEKAAFYLGELDKMMILKQNSQLSGGGFPYATSAASDTGHGWLTPKSPFAISIAGTAYGLFARYNFNPFCLKKEKEDYIS